MVTVNHSYASFIKSARLQIRTIISENYTQIKGQEFIWEVKKAFISMFFPNPYV